MQQEKRDNSPNTIWPLRSAIDLAMGVLYIAIPWYAIQTNYIVEQFGRSQVYTFGGLFAAYGLFRMIRGILAFRRR